jgi:uncharacterized protein YcbK (DUF882 family)
MSRTRKGQKPPGWEHWGNIREKELLRANYLETEEEYRAYIRNRTETIMLDKSSWKISESEFWMGREASATPEIRKNAEKLLIAINLIRDLYGKPMQVTSGFRPPEENAAAHGKTHSSHLSGEACDFADNDSSLTKWCLLNLDILAQAGLYMESPIATHPVGKNGWVHLQTRAPGSGKRVFIP